ncbi:hypothetical protein Agub_g4041, partial [Astrephomene gubernaculifera]
EGGKEEDVARAVARNMTLSGVIAPLVREVRLGHPASLAPSLAVLRDCLAADASDPRVGGNARLAGHEAVGAGLLSLCAQLLFKAVSDPEARVICSSIVRHLVAANSAGSGRARPGEVADSGSSNVGGGKGGAAAAAAVEGGGGLGLYGNTTEGRMELAADLLRVMRETQHPDLHNAVLEACRDVAPAALAAQALVRAGAVPHAVHILSHTPSRDHTQGGGGGDGEGGSNGSDGSPPGGGLDASGTAWVLQSQRSAAALLALLALQPPLRQRAVAEGALGGLAAALRSHSGQPGLMAQVRVTAAAALVPLLGEDGRYDEAAVAAGVLEPLVRMHYSRSEAERRAADRVLG